MNEREQRALDDILHWIWTFRSQLGRFADGLKLEGVGQGRERRKHFSRMSAGQHFLTLAAEHHELLLLTGSRVFAENARTASV